MEKEYVDALQEKDFYQVFYQKDGDISELINILNTLNNNVPIGWTNSGKIFIGWWGRIGFFYPKKEEFYDAFDHETYHTKVWHYSPIPLENTVSGVEIHGKGSKPNPNDESDVVIMKTVNDVKTFLSQAQTDAKLFAPDTNFELGGSLDTMIRLHTAHDIANNEYLLLCVDDES
ncbi:MAG: hypothetical protein LUG46_03785 [Erysipelotrichaceae bacterium]|nr:hypothetical protein [Erysipelotrichaceae bacterium]